MRNAKYFIPRGHRIFNHHDIYWDFQSALKTYVYHESQCDQVLETKQVNVSYLEQVRIKKHSLCLKIPPVCADWVNTMVTRWKLENVTRTVDKQMCCPGYQQASDAGIE